MKTIVLVVFAFMSVLPSAFAQRQASAVDRSGFYVVLDGDGPREIVREFGGLDLTKTKYGSEYVGSILIMGTRTSPPLSYKFYRVSITSNRLIAATESRNGKAYKFEGVFRGQSYDSTIYGDLTELRSGKPFKKSRLKLSYDISD